MVVHWKAGTEMAVPVDMRIPFTSAKESVSKSNVYYVMGIIQSAVSDE